jgi:hypothetical protein
MFRYPSHSLVRSSIAKFDAMAREVDEEDALKKEMDKKKNRGTSLRPTSVAYSFIVAVCEDITDAYFKEQAEKQRKWNEKKKKEAEEHGGEHDHDGHGHGHGHGHSHDHDHSHHNHSDEVAKREGVRPQAISRGPSCGCGFVDPDELKRLAYVCCLMP